jgi:hypothetical protein
MNFRKVGAVAFPQAQGRKVNMMPFIMGDRSSIPGEYHDYLPMIEACDVRDEIGKVGYLTFDEQFVTTGTHRRGGIHTEGWGNIGWVGGSWGDGSLNAAGWGAWGGNANGGLFIANSVPDSCELYDAKITDTVFGGAVSDEQVKGISPVRMPANTLFWLHDRTPHASLPVNNTERQFFRLVTSEVSVWFAKHSTLNRLGVAPCCKIIEIDKFQ